MKWTRWLFWSVTLLAGPAGVASLLLRHPASATAQEECGAERCAAQPAIEQQCRCEEATNHGVYVSCVSRAAQQLVSEACLDDVVGCAANSTCGKKGGVTCLKPTFGTCDGGTCVDNPSTPCSGFADCMTGIECSIEPSAAQCLQGGGTVSTSNTCCTACPPPTTTTTTTTTTTITPTTLAQTQCCVMPLGTCILVSPAQCRAEEGIDVGPGNCAFVSGVFPACQFSPPCVSDADCNLGNPCGGSTCCFGCDVFVKPVCCGSFTGSSFCQPGPQKPGCCP